MKYSKPALSLADQVKLLVSRGMLGDAALMEERLGAVSYYRLSGYWVPFQNGDSTFKPNTDFTAVWNRYVFDRRLRLLVMDAIERIEVTVRSLIAYHHSHEHGPFSYLDDCTSLPKLSGDAWQKFYDSATRDVAQSKEQFIDHFKQTYTASPTLPLWMAAEVMSFGTVVTMFRGATAKVKQNVASAFGMPHIVFNSWLLSLNAVRNMCAHHSRLWNRVLGVKPRMPDKNTNPEWHIPVLIRPDRMFGILTICRHCTMKAAPQSKWGERAKKFIEEAGSVPIASMGFPVDWKDCPIWQ